VEWQGNWLNTKEKFFDNTILTEEEKRAIPGNLHSVSKKVRVGMGDTAFLVEVERLDNRYNFFFQLR